MSERSNDAPSSTTAPPSSSAEYGIEGERHIPSVNSVRPLQSRVTTALGIVVMCGVAVALLGWYYARAFQRPSHVERSARVPPAASVVPPLPAVPEPSEPALLERMLGPAPAVPSAEAGVPARTAPRASRASAAGKPDRVLTGPVYQQQGGSGATRPAQTAVPTTEVAASALTHEEDAGVPPSLATLMASSSREMASAVLLPRPRFMLKPGATIDCTLETAIDSRLPGMVRCVTATDTWSADGSVVLLERGSQLVGETRGVVAAGRERIFILWTQAYTPAHVVVPLDSPGADALGRAGVTGAVNYRFLQRFGAALLVSVIDGSFRALSSQGSRGDAIVINPSGAGDLMSEILRDTLQIPPTVGVHQGARLQVFVARPVDFGAVYGLEVRHER